MREIKFRGYDLRYKRWQYGAYIKHIDVTSCMFTCEEETENFYKEHTKHLIAFDGLSDWWMPRGIDVCTSIDPESIGQFTGLIDRNKKEIFEGDLIKFTSLIPVNDKLCKLEAKVGEVVFEECAFWLKFKDEAMLLWVEGIEYEVVGNIYENPELWEGNYD